MNRKIFVGIAAVTLAVTLTGCSQVHFGKDAVTIGEVKQNKKTVNVKKAKSAKVQSSSSKKIKPKKDSKKKIKENKKNRTNSPTGKAKYDYNVLAIANDDFKSWHNTYLFCLKSDKPVILLDQSRNGNPIVVKVVKDTSLNKIFSQLVK